LATTSALIVAAGRGSRAAAGYDVPKQYVALDGEAVLTRTVRVFLRHPRVDRVLVVIHPDDKALYHDAIDALSIPGGAGAGTGDALAQLLAPVAGGVTRQASVLGGLEALAAAAGHRAAEDESPTGHVLIHDAARPFVPDDVISSVIDALDDRTGAIAALPVVDTLKRAGAHGEVEATVSRDGLWRAQTPQGFPLAAMLALHRRAVREGADDFTDDAGIAEWGGLAVRLVTGAASNIKLTTPEDLALAEGRSGDQRMAQARDRIMETRVGNGFDVHKFGPGDHLWLCGVRIDHVRTLVGHSDADVGLHALTDAILGALGDGDIGQHFPPSDPQWKGAASDQFLAHAAALVKDRGGRLINVDVTLICEEPKVGPHREAMRARVAEILGIDVARVGVKATTSERLGFTGRGEGIAAIATASVMV